MKQSLIQIALVVRDYDEAINYYRDKLGFELVEDTSLSDEKRWVVVSPKNGNGANILLAKASNDQQQDAIGNQAGGRVFLFLATDDIDRDYRDYLAKGVEFTQAPTQQEYGKVAVFEDLYGNRWDLIQHAASHHLHLS